MPLHTPTAPRPARLARAAIILAATGISPAGPPSPSTARRPPKHTSRRSAATTTSRPTRRTACARSASRPCRTPSPPVPGPGGQQGPHRAGAVRRRSWDSGPSRCSTSTRSARPGPTGPGLALRRRGGPSVASHAGSGSTAGRPQSKMIVHAARERADDQVACVLDQRAQETLLRLDRANGGAKSQCGAQAADVPSARHRSSERASRTAFGPRSLRTKTRRERDSDEKPASRPQRSSGGRSPRFSYRLDDSGGSSVAPFAALSEPWQQQRSLASDDPTSARSQVRSYSNVVPAKFNRPLSAVHDMRTDTVR